MNIDIEKYVSFMKNLEKFVFCMNSKWEKIIKAYDLTLSSYPFFEYIENNPGATQQEMASFFKVDKAVSSRACKYLESRNLIERMANSSYSHGYVCHLTEKGRKIYFEIKKEGEKGFREFFGEVDVTEIESVSKTITLLLKKIEEGGNH